MSVCVACGNPDAIKTKTGFEKNESGERVRWYSCEKCSGGSMGASSYRDAAGNVISFPTGGLKDNFSDSVGEVVTSKRQFSDILKRDGLRQNGGHFTNMKSLGRYSRPVKV